LRVSLAIVVLHNSILAAQQPKQVPPAPIPAPILVAKKVFVANAGGEEPWKDNAQFNGDVDRSYSQFYGALKTWGRYELVGAPADADLLFEIQFTVLSVAGEAAEGIGGRPYDPEFRLIIRDQRPQLCYGLLPSTFHGRFCRGTAIRTSIEPWIES
jgi:hypothetical protein